MKSAYTSQVIKAGDEAGELMLVQDILLKREYNHNHSLEPEPVEIPQFEIPAMVETVARFGVRLIITKLTGGLL